MLRRFATIFQSSKKVPSSSLNTQPNLEEQKKLQTLVKNSTRILYKINSVFPFDFFPDTLLIDPLKINYIHRTFFLEEEVKSILIENMGHVIVSSGPIFSTLTIVDTIYSTNTIIMKPIIKKQAFKAQNILQGLIVSKKENIDTAKAVTTTQISTVEAIGKPIV